jgi:hypothetical protein
MSVRRTCFLEQNHSRRRVHFRAVVDKRTKDGGGNRYLLTTSRRHKNRPLYISVPLRIASLVVMFQHEAFCEKR